MPRLFWHSSITFERERNNSIRSRNARLAAIRAFLHDAAGYDPEHLSTIQRSLAIPMKRFRSLLGRLPFALGVEAVLEHQTPKPGVAAVIICC